MVHTPLDFAKLRDKYIIHITRKTSNSLILVIGIITLVFLMILIARMLFS